MKRSASAAWILLVLLAIGLLLLVDPMGWFAAADIGASPASPEVAAPPAVDETVVALDSDPDATATEPGGSIERKVVDPLLEEGIAAFRVLDWNGRHVTDAQVMIARGEDLRCDQRTDREGMAKVAADGEAAGLVVALVARPLEWFDVVLTAGRHDLTLTEGGRLRGRFETVGGGSPGKLHVSLDSDRPPTVIPHLPAVMEENVRAWVLRGAYATFDTDEEGGFDITGLPTDWSGTIRMRGGWKVVSTTHGEVGISRDGVRFTESAVDIVIRLGPRYTLYGRLVRREDGSPLDGAPLAARLRAPQARQPTSMGATTDEDGRFSFVSKEDQLSEFELRLGPWFPEGVPLLRLDAESLPPDGDLGDVAVEDVRHVPFLLQDADAVPIARGAAVAAGVRSEPTGEDGRGVLRWVAQATRELVAEAPGFVPTAHGIPSVVADSLVVTLERANQLDVKLILPEGSKPEQFRVVLRGEGTITAGPVRDIRDQLRHVALGRWAVPIGEFSSAPPDTFLFGQPDPRTNAATFYALQPGVGIQLEVRGIAGDEVYHSELLAPLAPAEHRALEVTLRSGMLTFRGHVRDEEGRPLQLAFLHLGYEILGTTDVEGAFEFSLAGPKTDTLLVQHETCTSLQLDDYVVPTDGRPVEFRLKPARPLTIEVVDENGAPVPEAEVHTQYGKYSTSTGRIGGSRHRVSAMPDGPFVIRVDLAGRHYNQDHDPSVSEARVVVPVHGSVVGIVDSASTTDRRGRFQFTLYPQGVEGARWVAESRDSGPDLRLEVPAVHPGTYRAVLSYTPSADEKAAGRERQSLEHGTVVVEPGEETEVRLALSIDDG